MASLRHKTRRMFRRLSWIIGIVFGFIGGVVFAGLIVTAPDLSGLGIATSANGIISSPNSTSSGFTGVVLWMVATTMCFGVGFMLMRIAGWLIESVIPHHHRRERSSERGNGAIEEYDVDNDPLVEVNETLPEIQTPQMDSSDLVPETCAELVVETPEPPAPVAASRPRATKRVDRPRVKIGRGVRSGPNTESAEKPRFRR